MNISLNDVLLSVPLYQLTFVTPFPNEEIFYEHVVTSIPDQWQDRPTLLIIETKDDWMKLNSNETANHLIQQSHLIAIIIYHQMNNPLQNDMLTLYQQCQIPIIQVKDYNALTNFYHASQDTLPYSNLSLELDGFYQRGFMDIATNLSMAFDTPLLFLDENKQLLWHTGSDKDIKECLQWLHAQTRGRKANQDQAMTSDQHPFDQHTINVAGQIQLSLITSIKLALWQKKIIDKFIGFTAVLFQTEELVREQNESFKEFFIYELLYGRFESKKTLLKQGKTWGWNLENPHHLLIVDIKSSSKDDMIDANVLNKIVFHLETQHSNSYESLIMLPFRDHIIVLIEDSKGHLPNKHTSVSTMVAERIEHEIIKSFPQYDVYIGIGKWYHDTIDLNKSYQEAKIAIQFGRVWFEDKQIYHMNELGVLHLLSNIHRDLLHDFCREYLDPLIKSDQENDTEYLKTLKIYFQYHGVINDVADALFIHPNTLRKRLNNMETLIGMDRRNLEQSLTLMVAIAIYYSFA